MSQELVQILPWAKNFETGISLIDKQHMKLVQLINRLASHLSSSHEEPVLAPVLDDLMDYANYHFRTEEAVWSEHLPDDLLQAEHKDGHEGFVKSIQNLMVEGSNKPFDELIEEVLKFLTNWLVFHILGSDMRMAVMVLAIQSGMTPQQAKEHAESASSGAANALIQSMLTIYDNLTIRTLKMMREVINRQKVEAKLHLASRAVKSTLDSICITDPNYVIIDANPSCCETTQYTYDELMGMNLKTIKSGLSEEQASAIWDELQENGHWVGETSSRTKNNESRMEWLTLSSVKDEQGLICNYIAVFSNIDHLLKKQRILQYHAHHDSLTGLPNRALLTDRLNVAIAHARRKQNSLAVCYLDLDGFKPVNDCFGHAAGDQVLQEVARRIKKIMRGNDTVARIGGDEFVLLLVEIKNPEDYKELLDRLLQEIELPIQIKNDSVNVTASVGVTIFPQDNSMPEVLLHHADEAMLHIKNSGKSAYHLYATTG